MIKFDLNLTTYIFGSLEGVEYQSTDVAEVNAQLAAWWDANQDSFEYVDNSRFCLVGDLESEKQYDDVAFGGCCGSHDEQIGPSPLGNSYRFGFNHGH